MMACHSVLCFESLSTKPNTDQPAAFLGQSNASLLSEIVKLWWFVCLFYFLNPCQQNSTQISWPPVSRQSNASLRSENCQIMMVKDCQNYELKIVKIMSQKIVKLWWPLTSTVICIKISDFNLPPSNNF